jgi:hypothetical protein
MLDVGFLPKPGVGPALALAYLGARFRAELWSYWLPARETSPDPNGRVAVSLWAFRPTGCGRLWGKALGLDLCLGLELGRSRGRGRDLASVRDRSWFYRSAWAALRFSSTIRRRWGLFLEPGLAIPFGRPRFVSDAGGTGSALDLHTPTVVSARVTLGLEARF